jgi:hypothetical protein
MPRINGRNKGANAEREAATWLKEKFKLEHLPQRNIEQYRYKAHVKSTGYDLTGFEPFCLEIKRQEVLSLRTWWVQCVQAVTADCPIPVVMYRQNRKPWKFLISAKYIGLRKGYIHLEAKEFNAWAEGILSK